jgi:catechol 2,3-dioxygenase-like lactoylglutathione lyase family enzyme
MVMELHPIMYVADQYAERDFYERFGFERVYEGEEFPGFLAIRHGAAVIGLQKASAENPPYAEGLRWQFELTDAGELDQMIGICQAHNLEHEVDVEVGGDRFRRLLLSVRSPAGVIVCFEGANETDTVAE